MTGPRRKSPQPPKTGLHPRNRHRNAYDLAALSKTLPALSRFIRRSPRGDDTLDFSDPEAVITLNTALLKRYYKIQQWNLPAGHLCPPVPGRVDYIHYLNDLIEANDSPVRVLDIGTGASLIYPLLAASVYGWEMIGSDIAPDSLAHATQLLESNPNLAERITLRQQTDPSSVFHGIIQPGEYFSATLCNPPFHRSASEAAAATDSKQQQLQRNQHKRGQSAKHSGSRLNFGGKHHELWCDGGEAAFIERMMTESRDYAGQVGWFTCLVSRQTHLPALQQAVRACGATDSRIVKMQQGQKHSRFIAWRFDTTGATTSV